MSCLSLMEVHSLDHLITLTIDEGDAGDDLILYLLLSTGNRVLQQEISWREYNTTANLHEKNMTRDDFWRGGGEGGGGEGGGAGGGGPRGGEDESQREGPGCSTWQLDVEHEYHKGRKQRKQLRKPTQTKMNTNNLLTLFVFFAKVANRFSEIRIQLHIQRMGIECKRVPTS